MRVTLPREVLPGCFYMVSRRCTQRLYLMRPDDETNNAFTYCLAEAANMFGIDVLLPVAMSNHYHAVVYDRHGNYPAFLHRFHELFAKSQNALRGRWENFWSADAPSVVQLVDREDVLRKLVYVATNPVNDHLVDRVHHWPGVSGLRALKRGEPMCALRPRHFFRSDGPMPSSVELHLAIPDELGTRAEVLQILCERIASVEAAMARLRTETGTRIVGRRSILKQHWNEAPTTYERRRTLNPQVAAGDLSTRIEALRRKREFVNQYRAARRLLLLGEAALFPAGTYYLRLRIGVRTEPLPYGLAGPRLPDPERFATN